MCACVCAPCASLVSYWKLDKFSDIVKVMQPMTFDDFLMTCLNLKKKKVASAAVAEANQRADGQCWRRTSEMEGLWRKTAKHEKTGWKHNNII